MGTFSQQLLEQERELTLPSFSNADALALGLAAVEIVTGQYHKGAAIHIERGREVLFSYLMDGAAANNQLWVQRKKRVTDLFGHSTLYVGENYREQDKQLSDLYPPAEYQAEGGCFPILLQDTGMVGTITVSGLISADDHAVCVAALRRLLETKTEKA